MILANLEERLTATDVEFVLRALSRGDGARRRELEAQVQQRGIDELLDDPSLIDYMRGSTELGSPSPALFLLISVRETLRRAGLRDRLLSDYVGSVLYEFGFRDRAQRIAVHDDQVFRYVADIVAELEGQSERRRFLLQVHLGNFTLWLSGVFPDHITARMHRRGGPALSYYESMGMQAYRQAASHRLAHACELADTFELAADVFPRLRLALNRLSDRVFFPNVTSADRLMRQVSDEFNAGGLNSEH